MIHLNFLSTDRDKDVAVESIKQAREIAALLNPKFNATEVRPGPENTSHEDLVRAAGGIIQAIQ